MTLVKTLIKTIVIKADGVYVSSMEAQKEPTNYKNYPLAEGEDEKYWNQISKEEQYEEAISAFTSSLIKVENPEVFVKKLLKFKNLHNSEAHPIVKGTFPAPDGLVMEVKEKEFYCSSVRRYPKMCRCFNQCDTCKFETKDNSAFNGKVATVSFLPDKEEEKVKGVAIQLEGTNEVYLVMIPQTAADNPMPLHDQIILQQENKIRQLSRKSELKEDVGEEKRLNITEESTPEEIADQVSDRLMDVVKESFEQTAAKLSPQEKPDKEEMLRGKYDMNPEKAADELISMGFTVDEYRSGVQADRIKRLETFKNSGVKVLIEMGEDIVEYGEEVMKIMKTKNTEQQLFTEEELEKAALEYARHMSSAPDKETPDWIITDFKAGVNWLKSKL